MSRFALVALLAVACTVQPALADSCTEALPVSSGQPTPCSGMLLPDEMARGALRLVVVEMPALRDALQREEELHRLDLERDSKVKAGLRAALAQTASEASDTLWISTVAVGAAGLILGALGGYLAGH